MPIVTMKDKKQVHMQNRKYVGVYKDGYLYYKSTQTRMTKSGPRTYVNIKRVKREPKLNTRGPDKKPRRLRKK